MAFRFRENDASVEAGLRRIALDQIDKAIATLAHEDDTDEKKVHDVRKRGKKLRGLIRLVRPAFPDYSEENADFRDMARPLSDLRDAKVMQDCYDLICRTYADEVDRAGLSAIRRNLTVQRSDVRERQSVSRRLDDARKRLEAARGRSSRWQLEDDGWNALCGGLAKTYGRAVEAMADAKDSRDPADMHEWRKRSKYHWYHMRLLKPVWPDMIGERAKQAHKLSNDLGDHHDLAVFTELLGKSPERYGSQTQVEVLTALADKLMTRLEDAAFKRGRKLFAEDADELTARIGGYWESWRRGAPDRKLAAG